MATNTKPQIGRLSAQRRACVEIAPPVSRRGNTMNNIFVIFYPAIKAAVCPAGGIKAILIPAAGIAVCTGWMLFIRKYRHLDTAKSAVIHAIENSRISERVCRSFNTAAIYLESARS